MNQNLDAVIRIEPGGIDTPGGTVTLFPAKVEIGQAIYTALAQIAAEELGLSLSRIRVISTDTGRSSNASSTTGSNSIQAEGNAIRQAAADARHFLLDLAASHLGVPPDRLDVEDGTVRDREGTGQTTYWELFGGRRFETPVTGTGTPIPPEQYTIVGQAAPKLNLPGQVTGKPCFVHDLDLPDMVHGRVVRPPGYGAKLISVNESQTNCLPGVIRVVRDGSFLGVIAEREEQAVEAARILRSHTRWQTGPPLPPQDQIYGDLLSRPDQAFLVVDGAPIDGPVPPIDLPPEAARTIEATYYRPYQMHASLGPSAALAHLDGGRLNVWTHSQGVHSLRGSLAQILDMPQETVRVRHVEGSGCYGHNGADDAGLDAALLARALPGRPVLLKWMREDEHAWEPYGPCMVVKMQGSLDNKDAVCDWNHDVWSYTHSGRPRPIEGASNLLAARHLAAPLRPPPPRPGKGHHGGIHRNADPLYAFSRRRIVKHFVPESPLRVSALRGLGSPANVFAIESFIDELALAANTDPVAFRLRHLDDERARDVIRAATEKAGWISGIRPQGGGHGRGLGFAQYRNQKCYIAVVIDVRVDLPTGQIHLKRAVIAADAGQIVNPDGIINQVEGGVIQSASWTLKEEVTFDTDRITSLDWETYPILTFPEIPEVETVLIDRPGQPSLGCGEATQGPTPAAIANAVFDATGVRLRQIPFTPERVTAALNRKS